MGSQFLPSLGRFAVASVIAALASASLTAQTPSTPRRTAASVKAWTAPRTPDGQPDLQGVWANNTITPLQRPAQWAGKEFLTDEEVAALKKAAASAVDASDDAVFGDALVLAAIANTKGKSFEPATGSENDFTLAGR